MDPWLAGLRSEGTVESCGQFEIDLSQGLRLLRQHQLTDPHRAVLHVIRAAVLLGSDQLSLRTSPSECEAEFPTILAPSQQISSLLGWLGEPRDSPRFQMALAINSALSYADVELTSWDGQHCARLRLSESAGRSELGREPPWRQPRTRVRFVKRRVPGLFSTRSNPEHDLVKRCCGWAPLRLTLDHQLLGPPLFGDRRSPELRIYARHAEPGDGIRLPVTRSERCLSRLIERLPLSQESQQGDAGTLVAALSLHRGHGAWFREGVRMGELSQNALVSAAGLPLDLSEENLREPERSAMIEQLEQYFQRLA